MIDYGRKKSRPEAPTQQKGKGSFVDPTHKEPNKYPPIQATKDADGKLTIDWMLEEVPLPPAGADNILVDKTVLLRALDDVWRPLCEAQEERILLRDIIMDADIKNPAADRTVINSKLSKLQATGDLLRRAIERLLYLRKAVLEKVPQDPQ